MKVFFIIILLSIITINQSHAKESFFNEAKIKFEEKKNEESKFLLQRHIVFNPKHAKSYLYLAKIYKIEKNTKKEIKNLKTTLLLEPDNEEALYLLIDIELKRSNFSEVKKLTKNLEVVCDYFCIEIKKINKRLKNIENKNESEQ